MIRQRKNKRFQQKSSFKLEQFEELSINGENHHKQRQESLNSHVFEQGILKKFLNINLNSQNPLVYSKNDKRRQLIKSQRPFLLIKGQSKNSQTQSINKQNQDEKIQSISNSKSKITFIHTTGNKILSFKAFKANETKLKRPLTCISSNRTSLQLENTDNSISRILGQIRKQSQQGHQIEKISTSKGLAMFSKVIRNHQNTSRQMIRRRIKTPSIENIRSVSVLANRVKIEPKSVKSKDKMDLKAYLKRFSSRQKPTKKKQKKQQEFNLQGWDTNQVQYL